MKYRYQILDENQQVWEGWAHSEEEMAAKFNELNSGLDFLVFLYGNVPTYLRLEDVRLVRAELPELGDKAVRMVDQIIGRLIGAVLVAPPKTVEPLIKE